jgi:hypothetical protein
MSDDLQIPVSPIKFYVSRLRIARYIQLSFKGYVLQTARYTQDGSCWFLQNTDKLTFILPALKRGVPVQKDLVVR